MAREGIVIDETRWPIVRVTFFDEATDGEWAAAIDRVVGYTGRDEPFGVLIDGTNLTRMPSATQRKLGAALNERIVQARGGKNLVAWANAVRSPLVRGAILAMNWITPAPFVQFAAASPEEGFAWLTERLKATPANRAR